MKYEFNHEQMEKAKAAKSAEELLSIAKENGVDLTKEQADAYFDKLNSSGELSDSELDGVSGGGCMDPYPDAVNPYHKCNKWRCKTCGCDMSTAGDSHCHGANAIMIACINCQYCKDKDGSYYYCDKH